MLCQILIFGLYAAGDALWGVHAETDSGPIGDRILLFIYGVISIPVTLYAYGYLILRQVPSPDLDRSLPGSRMQHLCLVRTLRMPCLLVERGSPIVHWLFHLGERLFRAGFLGGIPIYEA